MDDVIYTEAWDEILVRIYFICSSRDTEYAVQV